MAPAGPALPGGEALGRSRGGFSTLDGGAVEHVRCDRHGRPLCFHLTGGEAADDKALPFLLDRWRVRRAGPGRPRRRPERLAADRAYSNRHVRDDLRRRRIGAVIPQPQGQRPSTGAPAASATSSSAWSAASSSSGASPPATRSVLPSTAALSSLAMLQLAAILLWLKV
jgi:hypothetical protein